MRSRPKEKGLSRIALIAIIIVVIILAAVAAGLVSLSSRDLTTTQDSSSIEGYVSQLAREHWASVDQKNLSAVMTEYSKEYQSVWFFFNDSTTLDSLNGKHDCNPFGNGTCSRIVESVWESFFNDTPSFASYQICNQSASIGGNGQALVSATLHFELIGNETSTMKVPYEIDFQLINGVWQLWKVYFGSATDPVTFISGYSSATCG